MDRFIALLAAFVGLGLIYLKSNMDRFIDTNKWRFELADHI